MRIFVLLFIASMAARCGFSMQATAKNTQSSLQSVAQHSNSDAVKPFSVWDSSIWIWNTNVVTHHDARAKLWEFCGTHKVRQISLYASNALLHNEKALRDFIVDAHTRNIHVSFVIGEPEWALTANHTHAIAKIDKAARVLNDASPGACNIEMDVEPYLTPTWKNDWHTVAAEYVQMLSESRDTAHTSGCLLTSILPFWFDDRMINVRETARPLLAWSIDVSDAVIIMAYRDTAEEIIALTHNEVVYATQTHKPISIAVETACIHPTYATFCEEGHTAIDIALRRTIEHYETNPVFMGMRIHQYETYQNLVKQ